MPDTTSSSATISSISLDPFLSRIDTSGVDPIDGASQTDSDTATLHSYGYRSAPTSETQSVASSGSSRTAVVTRFALGFAVILGVIIW